MCCMLSATDLNVPVFYRLWNKLPKVENIPNVSIDNAVLSPNVTFVRWKVHHDWVTQVTSFPFRLYALLPYKEIYLNSAESQVITSAVWFSGVTFLFVSGTDDPESLLSKFRQSIFTVIKLSSPHRMKTLRLLL